MALKEIFYNFACENLSSIGEGMAPISTLIMLVGYAAGDPNVFELGMATYQSSEHLRVPVQEERK